MKKFGKVVLAAGIILGGIGATQASAASVDAFGVAVNPVANTLNLHWHPEGAQVAIQNNNTIEVNVDVQLEDSQGNILGEQKLDMQPKEKEYLTFKADWKTDGTQYHYHVGAKGIAYQNGGSADSTPFTVTTGTGAVINQPSTTTNTAPTGPIGVWDGGQYIPTYIDNTSDTYCYLHC